MMRLVFTYFRREQLIYIGNQSATVMYDGLGFDDILLNFDDAAAGPYHTRLSYLAGLIYHFGLESDKSLMLMVFNVMLFIMPLGQYFSVG